MTSLLDWFSSKPKSSDSQNDLDQKALLEAKQQETYEARFKARVVQDEGPAVKRSEQEIRDSLSERFFEEQLDETAFSLEGWQRSSLTDEDYLKTEIYEKGVAYDNINNQLSSLIINNYNTFVHGMNQIHEVERDLKQTAILCRTGRTKLSTAKKELTSNALLILSKQRKLKIYLMMLDTLEQIKRLLEMEKQVRGHVSEGDYVKAVKVCVECRGIVNRFDSYLCVKGFSIKIEENFETLIAKIDAKLFELCRSFEEKAYTQVLLAHKTMAKIYQVPDKIQQYFVDNISTFSSTIVLEHAIKSELDTRKKQALKKLKFGALCSTVNEEQFFKCLLRVLEFMCDLMYSHYCMRKWHDGGPEEFKEVYQSMEKLRGALWDEMQRRVAAILSSSRLPSFKLNEFLKVFDAINKFIEMGEAFSSTSAHSLRGSIKQQSKAYFYNFHRQKMEDIYTMVENEMWQKCPLQKGFAITDIKEFHNFTTINISMPKVLDDSNKTTQSNFFDCFLTKGNPFNPENVQKAIQEALAKTSSEPTSNGGKQNVDEDSDDSDNDVDPELLADRIDEEGGNNNSRRIRSSLDAKPSGGGEEDDGKSPLVTLVSVNIARYIGQYLQMMQILSSISYEVFVGITQIFDFYLLVVHNFFSAVPSTPTSSSSSSSNLTQNTGPSIINSSTASALKFNLGRIREGLVNTDISVLSTGSTASASDNKKENEKWTPYVRFPTLGPQIDVSSSGSLYGCMERAVATESLVFLVEAMNTIKAELESLLPRAHLGHLTKFYSQSVDTVTQLRAHIYRTMSSLLINYDKHIQTIAVVKWEIKELGVEHNKYVDNMLKEFEILGTRLALLAKNGMIPRQVRRIILENSIHIAMEALVEGFSRARRCTPEGRALMSLDSKVFQSAIDSISQIRPTPHYDFVESYIKAYYLPEHELISWFRNHPEYSSRQVSGLISVYNFKTKKFREEALTFVEELAKKGY